MLDKLRDQSFEPGGERMEELKPATWMGWSWELAKGQPNPKLPGSCRSNHAEVATAVFNKRRLLGEEDVCPLLPGKSAGLAMDLLKSAPATLLAQTTMRVPPPAVKGLRSGPESPVYTQS